MQGSRRSASLHFYDPALSARHFAIARVKSWPRARTVSAISCATRLRRVTDVSRRIAGGVDRATRGSLSTTILDGHRGRGSRIT